MNVAIVLLNWNGKDWLKQFLPGVLEHSSRPGTAVYVADNASTDGSVDMLQEEFPQIHLIKLARNYGFAGGYNQALKAIDATYYVLLNTDVEVTSGWLTPMLARMESDPDIAAVQPKIKSWRRRDYFEYAGAAGGFIDKYGYPFCRGRMLQTVEQDQGQYDDACEIFWATGAAMLVRASLFHEMEGFDPGFFAHMEEIDLCWRFINRGYKIMYEPSATVYHVGGGTLPNESPHKLYLNYRNNLFLLYKNLPDELLESRLFMRKILDGLSALIYLASGKTHSFAAVWKAHREFYRQIRHLKAKRLLLNMKRKNEQMKLAYPKSLVWSYFAKKKHTFKALNW